MSQAKKSKLRTSDIVLMAMFTAIICICSWISIPSAVPFTMQTFGVFLTVGVLGGKRGSFSVFTYIMLGLIGIPVFSGFTGGIGKLMGNTGGYIIGFLASALVMWGVEAIFGRRKIVKLISMVLGLLVCYAFGTIWFMVVYANNTGAVGLWTVLTWCVIPYIIPDALKILLAFVMSSRLEKYADIKNI